jgi:hypothetical protein
MQAGAQSNGILTFHLYGLSVIAFDGKVRNGAIAPASLSLPLHEMQRYTWKVLLTFGHGGWNARSSLSLQQSGRKGQQRQKSDNWCDSHQFVSSY